MATKLFLHLIAPSEAGAPSGYQRCDRTQGPSLTTSVTNTVAGPTAGVQCTATAGGTALAWVSDPVLTSFTCSGTVTLNLWAKESMTGANSGMEVRLYKYSGGSEGSAFLTSEKGTELTTSIVVQNWTASPSSTVFAVGDRLVVKCFINDAGGNMGNGFTVTMDYDGATGAADGDSWVQLTENVAFTRTRTVKSSGGDYATLNAWNTGEAVDLTSVTEIRQAEVYALHDTTQFSGSASWASNSTYYPKIYTDPSARYAGGNTLDTSKYYLDVSGTAMSIPAGMSNVRIDGLQIQVTAASGGPAGISLAAAITSGEIRISDSIFNGVLSGTAASVVAVNAPQLASGAATLKVWNLAFTDWVNGTNSIVAIQAQTGWTALAYNCTAYNCRYGYSKVNSADFTVINDAAMSCFDGFIVNTGSFNAASDYNASDIASDAPGAHSQNGTAATFVDAANGNLQPASSDTVLKGNGTSDPGSGLFSDDITGTTRSTWDIGAWIAQAAVTNTNQLMLVGAGT